MVKDTTETKTQDTDIIFMDDESLDGLRCEEPWSEKNESLLMQWKTEILVSKGLHEKAGYFCKRMRKYWAIPSIILPATMAPLSSVFADTDWIKYLNMVSFIGVAIIGGLDSFFKYATRKEKHFNHAARYGELMTSIQTELFKKKKFRTQCDVYMMQISMSYNLLNSTAPDIPDFLLKQHAMLTEKKNLKDPESAS
jgi:hypothetical protein